MIRWARTPHVVIAVLATAMSVGAMLLRAYYSFSFSEPLHIITSGWEQQPVMGLWLWVHGLPVFNDFYMAPFYSAHYNWLFYETYGAFVSLMLWLTGASVEWIPTFARMLTFIGLPVLGYLCYRSYQSMASDLGESPPFWRLMMALFALQVAFGPLVGFWGITVRPDTYALLFEVAALLVFWQQRGNRARQLIGAAFFAYIAWSFKHSAIIAPGTIVLFLISERRFRDSLLFIAMMVGAFLSTFALAGPNYLPSLFQAKLPFIVERGYVNLINFATKSAPQLGAIGLVLVILMASRERAHSFLTRVELRFVAIFCIVSLIVTVPAAAKEGAAENYYFMVSQALAALGLLGYHVAMTLPKHNARVMVSMLLSVGWGLHAVAVGGLLGGYLGTLSPSATHATYTEIKQCMSTLPKPIFNETNYLQLPIINPSEPPVFQTYNYYLNRISAPNSHQYGGVGGMIDKGMFATIMLSSPRISFDGESLEKYNIQEQRCGGQVIYLRKSTSEN